MLLFAADAQVGNWMSWHLQDYPAAGEGPKVTAKDLLERTVLYKVGHHASHNATLDKLGLALMAHPGLVAMIPVVEAEARRKKAGKAVHRGWDMPYPKLLDQLMKRTSGRILRGDAEPGSECQGQDHFHRPRVPRPRQFNRAVRRADGLSALPGPRPWA